MTYFIIIDVDQSWLEIAVDEMWRVTQRSASVDNKTTTRWLGSDKLWTRIAVELVVVRIGKE
jgi:hypothetical protein